MRELSVNQQNIVTEIINRMGQTKHARTATKRRVSTGLTILDCHTIEDLQTISIQQICQCIAREKEQSLPHLLRSARFVLRHAGRDDPLNEEIMEMHTSTHGMLLSKQEKVWMDAHPRSGLDLNTSNPEYIKPSIIWNFGWGLYNGWWQTTA